MATRSDRAQRRRTPRILLVLLATGLSGAAIIAIGSALDGDDAGDEAPSTSSTTEASIGPPATTATTNPPDPIPLDALRAEPVPSDPALRYRVTYEVVENTLRREETWTVQRPYESLVVVNRDDVMISGTATSRTALWDYLADRAAWLRIQPELHRAAFDLRPLDVMATMIELGLAEPAGEGSYVGRTCRVYRVAEPVGSGSVSELGGSERTEVCIDAAGVVLHERWEIDGSEVSVRTATQVEIDPVIDPAIFDPTPVAEDVDELERLLTTIAVKADEEILAELRTDIVVPEGYVDDGAVFRASTSEAGAPNASEVVRFYSSGPDLVEYAEVAGPGPVSLAGGGARPIEVEGFAEVWFDADFRVSTIRAAISDERFLELRGTDPALLLELLESVTVR